MATASRPLAVVTGASSGIGFELARYAATQGFDLIVAANEPEIHTAAGELKTVAGWTDAVEADLATSDGVAKLWSTIQRAGRPVDVLCANAGTGHGGGFLDQDFETVQHIVNTNVTGTLDLIQRVGRQMRDRGEGRILITGSIAGFMPGTYNSVYNGSKAFLDSFSFALRHELADSGVSVTCLMPGATDTEFFARADMVDTKLGQAKKDDPAMVAKTGWDAMMRGDGDIVSGWKNKIQSAIANVIPAGIGAGMHGRMAEPGSGHKH